MNVASEESLPTQEAKWQNHLYFLLHLVYSLLTKFSGFTLNDINEEHTVYVSFEGEPKR